jgi:hypothetical protein
MPRIQQSFTVSFQGIKMASNGHYASKMLDGQGLKFSAAGMADDSNYFI